MANRALNEMERVLDGEAAWPGRSDWSDVALRRWRHGPLHQVVEPMSEHVVMTYLGTPRRIERVSDGQKTRSVTEDRTVTIIPANSSARWDIAGDLDVVHIYVAPERLRRVAVDAGLTTSSWSLHDAVAAQDSALSDLIRLLARETSQLSQLDRLYSDTLAELICLHLVRAHGPGTGRPVEHSGRGLAPWQVRRSCDYLSENIDRQVGLAELATLLDLSAKHFCTAFRKATGEPPHRWLRRKRITEAQRRLYETRDSVLTIALALGYSSEAAFSAMFRRETGRSPTEHRQLARL